MQGQLRFVLLPTRLELARTNVRGTFGQPAPYSVTLPAFADDAAASQTIIVSGFYGGSGIPQQRVTFTLPAAAPVGNFTVTAPQNGQTLDSRTVTFTGTGTEGSTVNVLDVDGNRAAPQAVVTGEGQWTTTGTYADDAPVAQTVNINQVTGGAGRGEATVSFTLPAPAPVELPAPVITSPTEGQIVTGTQVTFEGTGTPGAYMGLLVVPTELLEDAAPQARAAAPAPADPADPILVDENGTWTVTLALLPENYTAVAVQAADPEGVTGVSAFSEPVKFSLVAAVPAPAGGGSGAAPAANPTNPTLAATGGADPSIMIGAAVLTLLVGAGALVVGKRRRVLS